jgi:hypothetical protein
MGRARVGFRVDGSEFRVQGSAFRVHGSGFRFDSEPWLQIIESAA